MYKITIDTDEVSIKKRFVSAHYLLDSVGEEVNDCVLLNKNRPYNLNEIIDLEEKKEFITRHPSFICSDLLIKHKIKIR